MIKQAKGSTQKEDLFKQVRSIYDQSLSVDHFKKLLLQYDIPSYERNGRLTGVYCGKRKYRFKTLGIESHELQKLEAVQKQAKPKQASRAHDVRQESEAVPSHESTEELEPPLVKNEDPIETQLIEDQDLRHSESAPTNSSELDISTESLSEEQQTSLQSLQRLRQDKKDRSDDRSMDR